MEDFKAGLSGIRGIVGETLSDEAVFNLGLAFAGLYKGKILIGRDTRPSGKKFSRVLIEAVTKSGREAIDFGILPTPALLLLVKKMKAGGGIMITASHNPEGWNGLKFINSKGFFLNPQQFRKFLCSFKKNKSRFQYKALVSEKKFSAKTAKSCGIQALDSHIQAVIQHLDGELIKKRKFKVGIDPVNGAGAVITRKFLEKLNCRVFSINETPDGRFGRPPEPLSRNLKNLSRLVKKRHLDLGFAQDPDADRLALVSERGIPIGEEYTLPLAFKAWMKKFSQTAFKRKPAIVINLATTRMIDDVARGTNWKVWRTKVGEVNVVRKMKEIGALFGGEGNGGVICPSINWARDSLVGMGLILELLASSNQTISKLRDAIPRYHRFNDKIEVSSAKNKGIFSVFKKLIKKRTKNCKVSFSDGIRVEGENFWWLVRPSNTEPVIRIMGETKDKGKAETLLESLKKELKG